ncbi:MAG: hypothetical protein IPP88_14400 [Betaproteobacteria bacterium]|nr:hypothetical protein [Betaproteobacteria bacterium]
MGLIFSVPLLGWVVSSAALIIITTGLPNGLQGVYKLQPYNSVDTRLDTAIVAPSELLKTLSAEYGIKRVHWLRLEARGTHLWYVVRPTPFSLAMTFDARTGARLDPLSDELLAIAANETLAGTRIAKLDAVREFNRDYEIDRVPAVAATMVGEQPSILMLSRDSGRTLRRLDADAASFNWWYKAFHVNQYTDNVIPWTALLYACVAGVITLALFGYLLFWWRRKRAIPAAPTGAGPFTARNLHRKVGVVVGGVLIMQLFAGTYIWLSLGPLNDPFRGKTSFARDWSAGIPAQQILADSKAVLTLVAGMLPASPRPVQAIEWRKLGNRDAWFVTSRKDERPVVFDAATGARIDALHPDVAGEIARQETVGQPTFDYLGPLHFASMDLNQRLPAYRFRFKDANVTDIYVLQNTGEIIMRRPAFWRLFGPFLATHMLAVSKNKVVDITLLALFQIGFLVVIVTGWRLQFPGKQAYAKKWGRSAAPVKGSQPISIGADNSNAGARL